MNVFIFVMVRENIVRVCVFVTRVGKGRSVIFLLISARIRFVIIGGSVLMVSVSVRKVLSVRIVESVSSCFRLRFYELF